MAAPRIPAFALLAVLACRGSSLPAGARDSAISPDAAPAMMDSAAAEALPVKVEDAGSEGRTDAREIINWLDPCYIDPSFGGGPGVAAAPECYLHACLRFVDPQSGCLRQGCSATCKTDGECPANAYCDPTPPLSPSGVNGSVCRPGQRGAPPAASCPDAGH